MVYVAACKIMRFQWIAADIETRFHSGDAIVHNQTDWNFAQPHPNHFAKAHRRVCDSRPEPETEKVKKNDREHERKDPQHRDANQIKRFHIEAKIIGRETTRKGLIAHEHDEQKVEKRRTCWLNFNGSCWNRSSARDGPLHQFIGIFPLNEFQEIGSPDAGCSKSASALFLPSESRRIESGAGLPGQLQKTPESPPGYHSKPGHKVRVMRRIRELTLCAAAHKF